MQPLGTRPLCTPLERHGERDIQRYRLRQRQRKIETQRQTDKDTDQDRQTDRQKWLHRPAIQAWVWRTWWYHSDGRYSTSPGPTVTSSGRAFTYWGYRTVSGSNGSTAIHGTWTDTSHTVFVLLVFNDTFSKKQAISCHSMKYIFCAARRNI